jgi:hypothetical protein
MPFNDLEQIHRLFLTIPKMPRSMTLATAYLDAYKNTWTTETMTKEENDKAIKLYQEISEYFYTHIRGR